MQKLLSVLLAAASLSIYLPATVCAADNTMYGIIGIGQANLDNYDSGISKPVAKRLGVGFSNLFGYDFLNGELDAVFVDQVTYQYSSTSYYTWSHTSVRAALVYVKPLSQNLSVSAKMGATLNRTRFDGHGGFDFISQTTNNPNVLYGLGVAYHTSKTIEITADLEYMGYFRRDTPNASWYLTEVLLGARYNF